MAKKIIARNVIKRRKGYLYFFDKSGNAVEAKMKRGGSKGHRTCH